MNFTIALKAVCTSELYIIGVVVRSSHSRSLLSGVEMAFRLPRVECSELSSRYFADLGNSNRDEGRGRNNFGVIAGESARHVADGASSSGKDSEEGES